MGRPVTLFTGQWADLSFEEICTKASEWGYDGLEIACWGDHMDVRRAASDMAYVAERLRILEKHNLRCWALGAHLAGQCVGRPVRRAAARVRARRDPGEAGGAAPLGHRGDDRHRARRRGDGVPRRDRLHGLADLARVVLVPADDRGDGRGRRSRRSASSGRRSSTSSTGGASGSRSRSTRRRSRSISTRPSACCARSTTGRRSGSTSTRATWCGRGSSRTCSSANSRRGSTTCT